MSRYRYQTSTRRQRQDDAFERDIQNAARQARQLEAQEARAQESAAAAPVPAPAPDRFSYEITPRAAHLGGGWRLQLLEDGQEAGGGVYPVTEEVTSDDAHQEALDDGEAWLVSRGATAAPASADNPSTAGAAELTKERITEVGLKLRIQAFENANYRFAQGSKMTESERDEFNQQVEFARAIWSLAAPVAQSTAGAANLGDLEIWTGQEIVESPAMDGAGFYLASDVTDLLAAPAAQAPDQVPAEQQKPVAWMDPNAGCVMDAFLWQQDAGYPQYSQPVYTTPIAPTLTAAEVRAQALPTELTPMLLLNAALCIEGEGTPEKRKSIIYKLNRVADELHGASKDQSSALGEKGGD